MGADFAAFFEDVDVFGGKFGLGAGFVVFLDEVGEMESAGETGGACADDQDVGFELFALDGHSSEVIAKTLGRSAEQLHEFP